MPGKQAKILSDANIDDLLLFAETTRQPARNKVMVLLSAKAGLRAGEIAHLTWEMVTDPTGAVGTTLELPDHAAKKGSGRKVPLHGDLQRALTELQAVTRGIGPIIVSERGGRRNLVCQRLSAHWSRRLLFPLGEADIHYPRCPPDSSRRWVTARRSGSGWPSVHSNNSAIHRR